VLPYASDHRPARSPIATWGLILLTTALAVPFILTGRLVGAWREAELLYAFGLVPGHFRPLTLFTYPFVHESVGHLLINLFYLWVFGAGVEDAIGRRGFLLLYLAGGAVGGALQCAVTLTLLPSSYADTPIVGASAACATLVGLFAARYYRSRLAFVGLPFRPHVVAVVALFLIANIGLALWDLLHGAAAGGVANWAHVGGFVFGLACAQVMRLPEAGRRAYLRADAARAMDKSMPGSAVKRWEMLLARDPDNPSAHAELARAWLLLGDSDLSARHFLSAIRLYLKHNQRPEAAQLYLEAHQAAIPVPGTKRLGARVDLSLSSTELFAVGSTLEESKQFEIAAETLQMLAARFPESTEAETALLKAAHLYVDHLSRPEEARILLRLFAERYPLSPWRNLAADLNRRVNG